METFPTEASSRNARRYLNSSSDGNNIHGMDHQYSAVSIHSLYYTICQASFYIMCFRGRECLQYYNKAVEYYKNIANVNYEYLEYSDPQLIDISKERWNKICSHHLNPLKFCLESVRGEFLFLAEKFDLLEEGLLDKLIVEDSKLSTSTSTSSLSNLASTHGGVGTGNEVVGHDERRRIVSRKRRKVSSIQTAATLEKRRLVGGVGGLGKGSNPLDSFFPFDPYLLRQSYKFVEPHYRHWTGNDNNDDYKMNENKVEEAGLVDGNKHEVDDDELIDEDDSDYDDDEDDDEDAEEEGDHFDTNKEMNGKEVGAMSFTSATATVSMGGSEWTDDLSDNEVNSVDYHMDNGRTAWVNELKRGRMGSIGDDCW